MLTGMSRDHAQTVTHLPVLVEVDGLKEADGRGNFLPGDRAEESAVRVVRAKDIKARLPKIFPPQELDLFLGAIQLEQALGARDDLALLRASEKVRPWLPDFVDAVPVWQLDIGLKHYVSRKITGVNRRYPALLNYCRLMADRLQNVRLVIWFAEKEGRFLPALYCPDWKTAAFAFTFTGGIRVCQNPKCSKVFVPLADNVAYCEPACREAHRVARWRHRKGMEKKAGKSLR
jgi:hypothetical protein